ncbi:MAG: hypothetical protein M1457_09380 [bacterium]|nr:hypothetical protein [bacterium]
MRDLLGTTSLGVAFQGHTLRVINQRLEIQQQSDGKRMIDWKAGRIALSRLPLVIVPSGESDIWFSIRMVGALLPDEELRTVQFEVWRDAEWITMARAVLNNQGYAQLSLSTIETIAFSVQTVTAPKGEDPGLYDLGFYCLSSGQ